MESSVKLSIISRNSVLKIPQMCQIRTIQTLVILLILIIISPTFSTSDNHEIVHHSTTNRTNSIIKRRSSDYDKTDNNNNNNNDDDSSIVIQNQTSQQQQQQQQQERLKSGCGSCRMREEIKNRNLEIIKSEVLRRMGFQKPPNITGRILPPVPPHFLAKVDLEYGNMQSDQPSSSSSSSSFKTGYSITEEDDDYHVKTQEVLTFAQPYPRLRHSWRDHDILHFMFSDTLTKYHVSNATLYVYVKGTERRPLPDLLIEVFKVYKAPDHPDTPGLYRMVSKKITQPYGDGDWIQLDLTITVSEWFKNPRENLGFIVNATAANGRNVAITDINIDNGSKAPFVEISTMEARRRTRRNVGLNCDDKMGESLCCRYSLVIDFERFGWDFIIAPKRYDAHYCNGDCPYVTLQKYPHTHLLKIALPNSAEPCCAPRKLSAISMLYFDDNFNVVYGSMPGMVVDRCGCS